MLLVPTVANISTENDGTATVVRLESLSLIPGYLLSRGTDTRPPQTIKDLKIKRGGEGMMV